MAILTASPKMQFFDSNGALLVGGKLYTYAAGTTTPLATYTSQTAGTPNANPVIMDARGEASVWLGSSYYYMELRTSTDALIWSADNVGGVASASGSTTQTFSVANAVALTDAINLGQANSLYAPLSGTQPPINNFRLTLASGVPITTTDVTAATTLYCSPYKGNLIGLYDGTVWRNYPSAEFSIPLGTLSAALPYDVFCYLNAGVPTLELLAWTNEATRATALAVSSGQLVKSGDLTRCYLGTFYTSSTTTTEDSAANRFLWNYFNRTSKIARVSDLTVTWTYTTSTWRQARSSAANQFNFVIGVSEDAVNLTLNNRAYNTTAGVSYVGSIGFDSTTTPSPDTSNGAGASWLASVYCPMVTFYFGSPPEGKHFLAWLEYSNPIPAGTTTWTGATTLGLRGTFKC